jgi:hypothetical protein
MAHDIGVHVEPVPYCCLHAPTSSSALAHGVPAFPALPARRGDTLTVYPDWHGQAAIWTLVVVPAMRGVCIRLSRAASASRTPANGSLLAGAVARRVPARVRR